MTEDKRPNRDWKTRVWAWWEGYVLPPDEKKEAEAAAASAKDGATPAPAPKPPADGKADQKNNVSRFGKPLWSATRIQVAEKIWGTGYSTPGGEEYMPQMLKPLGLNPAMSVLDLSAGLGGASRLMAKTYGSWVTGLEASPVLAAAAQERSVMAGLAKQAPISHYDPETFRYPKRFDCIISKEFFVFVKNREGLTDAVEACLKPKGQLLFTDYVLEDGSTGGKALKEWRDKEPIEPHPYSVGQVVNSLQQRNLDIRITEDITAMHRGIVLQAIQMLTAFIEKHTLDAETKAAVIAEVELWARRISAMEDGLRCYRFFALKFDDGTGG